MTSYLSQATIKAAVDRLGEARAQSALVDYLIFKRALVISNTSEATESVVTGTRSGPYLQAIDELSKVAEPTASDLPYFSPFGARRDRGVGGRRRRHVERDGGRDHGGRAGQGGGRGHGVFVAVYDHRRREREIGRVRLVCGGSRVGSQDGHLGRCHHASAAPDAPGEKNVPVSISRSNRGDLARIAGGRLGGGPTAGGSARIPRRTGGLTLFLASRAFCV